MKAGMLFQPCFDLGVIVGAIVVQDHMDCHVLSPSLTPFRTQLQ
jgi:hypothetical protein